MMRECKISCQMRLAEIEEEVKTDRVNDRIRFNAELSILNMELEVKNQSLIVYIQSQKSLRDEIKTLKEILTTSRSHFKDLETVEFRELQRQLAAYNKKIEELGITDE